MTQKTPTLCQSLISPKVVDLYYLFGSIFQIAISSILFNRIANNFVPLLKPRLSSTYVSVFAKQFQIIDGTSTIICFHFFCE